MNKFLDAKLERLVNFTDTLSNKARICSQHIKDTLADSRPLRPPFTTRESVALMELGQIEKKLREVTAAAAAVRKALANRHNAKKRHTR